MYVLDDAKRVFSTNYTFWSEITLFCEVEVLQILVGGKQVWVLPFVNFCRLVCSVRQVPFSD